MATGSGAGAAAAPFEVSWEKLEEVFSNIKLLKFLIAEGLTVEYFKVGGDVLGLKVNGENYSWAKIATRWNKNTLHKAWGVDRDILETLLENGSCQSSLNCVLSFSFLTPNILFVLVCLLTAKKDTSGTSPQPLFYLDFLCGLLHSVGLLMGPLSHLAR